MPRKPAHLEMAGGKGLRQTLWERIREIGKGKPFELADLLHAGDGVTTSRDYIVGLQKAGYLGVITQSSTLGEKTTWKLVKDAGIDAPRVDKHGRPITLGLAQLQMWQTLRRHKGDINARELASYASTPAVGVEERSANLYLRALRKAGYLILTAEAVVAQRNGGRALARYRLDPSRNTGPKSPMIQKTQAIYDPNLAEVVWVAPVDPEAAIYGR